ncbi:microsomal triacylglycerol transfer protein [Anopheles aquasalis]|uniref:microsomal triacylglycerol transfer protein n=1 Tax=Anopheles aquasalis TaxID=42839 RepID=UPI00215B3F5E|nr:microsomal triacylglycerol transfer protein [Anopheles aquasalis]
MMMTEIKFSLLLVSLLSSIGSCYTAPAFGDAFHVGTEEKFDFINVVHVGNTKNATVQTGYSIRATIAVGTVWGDDETKLLKITISNPSLKSVGDIVGSVDETAKTPFYAWWNLGRLRSIYFSPSVESISVRNFQKGIAALFQYQLLDGLYEEEDPSGKCKTKYISHSTTRYHKSKSDCYFNAKRLERSEYPLRSSLKVSRSADFTVSPEGALQKMVSQDYVKYLLNVHEQLGAYYESVMRLEVEGTVQKIDIHKSGNIENIVKELNLVSDTLLINPETSSKCEGAGCFGVIELFKRNKKYLLNDKIGSAQSSSALLELVQAGRKASMDDLSRILKAKSSEELKGQLMDFLGAVQTISAHKVAKLELKYGSDGELLLAERYLQALAVGSRPQKEIIEDLLEMARKEHSNPKFTDTLIQSLASTTQRYAKLEGNTYDTDVVVKVRSFLTSKLEACSKETCMLQYIRGLDNLKCPKTTDLLMKLALNGSRLVSVAAMKALKAFSVYLWNDDFRSKFEEIFFQVSKSYDSSARTLALDILLDLKPDSSELAHLLQFLKSNDKAFEVKQYLVQKLRMSATKCLAFAVDLRRAIESDPALNNYDVLVPKGLSTALRRPFSSLPSFNASLTSLQEMSGGVLKRGIVDLTLEVGDESTSLFTLGLYARGLSAFVSSNEEESNEAEEETTAGMELAIQGTNMRPLEFFNGKGELMGHVWSGTASEPTAAYQAITLLQDNEEQFHSHNGATLNLGATGAVSIDLNGQVTMSLWGRNAQSKVEQNIGITMAGQLSLDTLFAKLAARFSSTQEPRLHLTSALDFSGDPALCMQLLQPSSQMKLKFVREILLAGSKQSVERKTSRTYNLNGLTHALNRKNNEMCNLIAKK